MKLLMLLILSMAGVKSWSAVKLPPPADLIQQASQGRGALRDVVFQIEKNIPEFTGLQQISPYMHILPDLQKLSDQFKLEDLYPRAVAILGENMFTASQKWLDVRYVQQSELVFFVQYADFNSAYAYAASIEYIMNLEKDLNILAASADNIEAIRLTLIKNLKHPEQIDLYVRKILSEKAAKVLLTPQLTEPQIKFWIQKISTTDGFLSFIENMSLKIIALKAHNALDSHVYLERLEVLKARMDLFVDSIPTLTFSSLGDQVAALLMQMIVLEVRFNTNEPEKAISLMKIKNVSDLTQQIINRTTPPSSGFVEDFLYLAQLLLAELKKANLKQLAQDFSTYLQKVIAPVLISKMSAEGHYELYAEDGGQKWTFTIIQSPTNHIYAALSDEMFFVNKSFFNVTYDVDNAVFVASQREPDMSPIANYTIHFKVNGEEIEVVDLYATTGAKKHKGKRKMPFPKYIGSTVTPGSLTGRYVGSIEYLDGAKKEAEVILTVFSSYTLGRLNMFDKNRKVILSIEYQYGNRVTDSSIFLTSGQLPSGTWNHMRGSIDNGKFKGVMLIGGRGIVTKEFTLDKK